MKRRFTTFTMTAVAVLAVVGLTATAVQAEPITIPLRDFLVFSGGGWTSSVSPGSGGDAGFETQIAGASLYYGNIGSNWDLAVGASDTHILGSVYAGRKLELRQNTAIGSDGTKSHIDLEDQILGAAPPPPVDGSGFPTFPTQLVRVVANDEASVGNATTKIFGDLDAGIYVDDWTISGTTRTGAAADTFVRISMPTVSITAGGSSVTEANATSSLPLAPDSYNTLTVSAGSIATHKEVYLQSGTYNFNSITFGRYTDLFIDLTTGPVNINIVGNLTTGQDQVLYVKGAGTGGLFVKISDAPELARLINWTLGGTFNVGGGASTAWTSIYGGIVYSGLTSGSGVVMDQRIDWYGALYAYDTIDLADHSRYNYVPVPNDTTPVPEPASLLLLGSGLLGLGGFYRRKKQ